MFPWCFLPLIFVTSTRYETQLDGNKSLWIWTSRVVVFGIVNIVVEIPPGSWGPGSCCCTSGSVVILLRLSERRFGFVGKSHHPRLLHDCGHALFVFTSIFLKKINWKHWKNLKFKKLSSPSNGHLRAGRNKNNNFWRVLAFTKMAFYRFFCWLPKQFWDACQTSRHLPKAIFEKNITFFSRFGEFSKLNEFSKSGKYKMPQNWKMLGLARLADIHQGAIQIIRVNFSEHFVTPLPLVSICDIFHYPPPPKLCFKVFDRSY